MASLKENIIQAIADFDDIEAALEETVLMCLTTQTQVNTATW